MNESEIDVLLQEHRTFPPTDAFRTAARVHDASLHDEAAMDPLAFWAREAGELEWSTPWDSVLEWTPPHAKWFQGGKLNVSVNCVDRHIHGPRRNKAAIIWEGEPGDRRTFTYWDVYREVNLAANMLKKLGVTKGDRVAIYLPMIPEAVFAMLACARIGAVHTVVFGGFSPESLRDRINDCQCKVLITADGGYRRGQVVPLKRNADNALEECPTVEHVLVVMRRRSGVGDEMFAEMKEGRDHWWHRLKREVPEGVPARADGRRGPAVHPLHVGHHRQAEGHRPHDRRLPHRGVRHDQVRVRPARRRTCSGAPPTSAGSPGTRTWCTGRWPTAPRASCTRARPTGRRRTASGRSANATASRSSTRRPRRSARS